jgi:hypothetical protein
MCVCEDELPADIVGLARPIVYSENFGLYSGPFIELIRAP